MADHMLRLAGRVGQRRVSALVAARVEDQGRGQVGAAGHHGQVFRAPLAEQQATIRLQRLDSAHRERRGA